MLSVAEEYLRELNPDAELKVFGQELNAESYAICTSDMMIKGQNPENIVRGNSFSEDGHGGKHFDYLLSNPPFGVDWKKVQADIEKEHARGYAGRFGAGLPRINDGSLLFLMHMISKMKPHDARTGEGGSRLAIVLNGSPLFSGDAGSGESEIRKWIIENDWLEAIVALPLNLFYNTGIATYVWVLSNRKPSHRRGRVQLIDATGWFKPLRKNLGKKNCELAEADIERIVETFVKFEESEQSRLFDNAEFGYSKVTLERPLRARGIDKTRAYTPKEIKAFKDEGRVGEDGMPVIRRIHKSGKVEADPLRGLFPAKIDGKRCVVEYEPDSELRDTETVPLNEPGGIEAFIRREVLPHAPDAWIDESKTAIGYEISFTRYFYKPQPLRSLEEIRADILALERETEGLMADIIGATGR
jgi:type I restriction enzyme M protein